MNITIAPLLSALRCALCHDALDGGEPCALCGTVLHADCRALLSRCPTIGCGLVRVRRVVRVQGRSAPAPGWWRPSLSWTAWSSLLATALVVAMVFNFLFSVRVESYVVKNGSGDVSAAEAHLAAIQTSAFHYRLDTDRWPETLEDLMQPPPDCPQWNGPYVTRLPVDPWGNPYEYQRIDSGGFLLTTWGADGAPGGVDVSEDITLEHRVAVDTVAPECGDPPPPRESRRAGDNR